MSEIAAEPPDPCCYLLLSGSGSEESQQLAPDRSSPRARHARGRFAQGRSGNPRGRPPGIPNPRRRVPDLVARPLSPEKLSALLDRKPHLLRPLAAQLLPPPLATIDPAERIGLDLPPLCTSDDAGRAMRAVLAALSRGDLAPTEALRIARRVRRRVRLARRLARLQRAARKAQRLLPAGAFCPSAAGRQGASSAPALS